MTLAATHAATMAPPLVPAAESSETARIADFVRRASFEATRPSDAELDALAAEIEAAAATGLSVHIVTQFVFSAAPILAWIARMRELGIEAPVRVGIAGPASVATLMRFAAICGVKTSARALARNAGLAKHL